MPIDFPSSPVDGQMFTDGNRVWAYSSAVGAWSLKTQTVSAPAGPQGNEGNTSRLTTRGDLVTRTSGELSRVPVGANNTVLTADSTQLTGLRWANPIIAGSVNRSLIPSGAQLTGSGLVLSGLGSNFASSPDSAALSITGDIDIKVKLAMSDWTPSTTTAIINKWATTGNQRSYQVLILTSGVIRLTSTTDGTSGTVITTDSTVATGITDGSVKWIRVTRDADNGSSQRVTKFYTSDDGTTWTQLGTTITTAGTTSQFDGTAQMEVGASEGSFAVAGTVYRTIIQSAYDTADNTTSLVYDANFETATADALAFTGIGDTGIKADGLVLAGRSGEFASSPDSAVLSITGDIDIKARVTMTDWTPAVNGNTIVAKRLTTGNQRSYMFIVSTDGTLRLSASTDGTAGTSFNTDSTVATGFADGATKWVRVTRDVNDGAGNRVTKFYTSDDGTTWTQLGTTITTVGTTSFFDGTAPLEIGSNEGGTLERLSGTVHRVIIQSAYDTANNTASLVFDADFDAQAPETVSFNAVGSTGIKSNGLVLAGRTGERALTTDSSALSITGDIDIKVKASMNDWSPAARSSFAAKLVTSNNQRSFAFVVDPDGTLRLFTSVDGTDAYLIGTSTVGVGLADGSTKWVRATLDVDNGSSQRVYKFYTSDDGTTWTQLGTTVAVSGTTSIFDSTSPLEIGALNNGNDDRSAGTIQRVIIQNAYDTADNTSNLVFDADFDAQAPETTSFIESSSNAARVSMAGCYLPVTINGCYPTVAINTTRYYYGIPGVHFYGVTTVANAANTSYHVPFVVTSPVSIDTLLFECTSAPTSTSTLKAAIYASNDNFAIMGAPVIDFGSTTVTTIGAYSRQITPSTLQPGIYSFAVNTSIAFTFRVLRGGVSPIHADAGSSPFFHWQSVSEPNVIFPTLSPVIAGSGSTANPLLWLGVFRWTPI